MRTVMQILWPAFLAATIGDGLLFSLVDHDDMVVLGHSHAGQRMAAYTLGFFAMWLVCALSSALTCSVLLEYPFWKRK